MNVHLSQTAVEGLFDAPSPVQKAFIKQINFLVRNLNHPSLRELSATLRSGSAPDGWMVRP
jgi:hypothetical protein